MNPEVYLEMRDNEARHWWFAARRKILMHIIGALDLPPNSRILEIGCGTGGNLKMLASFGQVSALEMNSTARAIAIEKAGKHFDIRSGKCPADISFAGEKFDLICLLDVLEHIKEDGETLVAAKEFLADGGRILVTVPVYQWLWSVHDKIHHHKRRYNAPELRRKALVSGLQIDKISYFNTLLFPLLAIIRLKDRWSGNSTATGTGVPPGPINQTLKMVFSAERFMLGKFNLPFGSSLLGVFQKNIHESRHPA